MASSSPRNLRASRSATALGVGGSSSQMARITSCGSLLFGGVGTLPHWGYSAGWGYGPSGILGLLLVILLIYWLLMGPRP